MAINIMNIKIILVLVVLILPLNACKVLKTHIVKLTGSAQILEHRILIPTSSGRVYFSNQHLTDKQKSLLQGLRPYQCLQIKTPEQFDMQNREVTFYNVKLKSLVESHKDCRNVKMLRRIEFH